MTIYDPITDELLVMPVRRSLKRLAKQIEDSSIEEVEIRSVLTCESKRGVCAICYGRNLASGKRGAKR